MRERPEVQAAYEDPSVIGFVAAPAPADIASSIKKFTSFSWNLPDNDLVARGNSHVFCNKFPDYKRLHRRWSKEVKNNINVDLLEIMSNEFEKKIDELSDSIVFYSYAVVNSNLFLSTFEGKLYSTAGEWPAIPITKDKTLFEQMVNMGRNMASIEKKDYRAKKSLAIFNEDIIATEVEISSFSLLDEAMIITVAGGRRIKSQSVAQDILHFESSGYKVVSEWLKYHSYAYYRKACGKDEFDDLFNLLGRICDYLDLVRQVDIKMEQILVKELIRPLLK